MIWRVMAVAAVCAVPGVRHAPLPVVALFLAGCVGAFVTRGWALSSITRALVRSTRVWYSPAHPLEKVTP